MLVDAMGRYTIGEGEDRERRHKEEEERDMMERKSDEGERLASLRGKKSKVTMS